MTEPGKSTNMEDRSFEKTVRDKLSGHETEIPPLLWEQIRHEIPGRPGAGRRILFWSGAAAALLAGALFLLRPFGKSPEQPFHTQTEQSPREPETTMRPEHPLATIATGDPVREHVFSAERTVLRGNATAMKPQQADADETGAPAVPGENETNPGRSAENKTRTSADTVAIPAEKRPAGTRYASFRPLPTRTKTPTDSELEVGLLASNLLSGTSTTVDNIRSIRTFREHAPLLSAFALPDGLRYRHDMPVSVGLTVEKRWDERWGIASGLTYHYLHSRYSTSVVRGDQYLHYIGIPLTVTCRILEWKKLELYAGAGGEVDFNVAGRYRERLSKNAQSAANLTSLGEAERNIDDRTQWSVQIKAGLSYPIFRKLRLYAEPALGYAFDNGSRVQNYWKERPWHFSLQVGLKYGF